MAANPSNGSRLTVGEFFSGPGGMALGAGLAAAGTGIALDHAFAVDADRDACATYARNILRRGTPLPPRRIEDVAIETLPAVDLFLFGFPCNDFSMVGESRGLAGDYGPLYRHAAAYLKRHRPMAFVAENVPGLLHANAGARSAAATVLPALRRAGYDVVAHLFRLENYGVPQTRHRVFIVGTRRDLRIAYAPPAPIGGMRTSRQALERPPIPPDAANHEPTPVKPDVAARLALIRPGENVWQAQASGRIPPELALKVTGAALSNIYRRLDPDLPAYTVTSGGGGGTYGYHWAEDGRPLTNRERARLMTFPDAFVFEGSRASVRRQIGMAVPPRAAEIVVGTLLEDLFGRRTTPRCASNVAIRPPKRDGRGNPGHPSVSSAVPLSI